MSTATLTTPTQKPPHGMTQRQRSLAEKAVRLRYSQIDRAIKTHHDNVSEAITCMPREGDVFDWILGHDDDNCYKGTVFEKDASELKDKLASFKKRVIAAREKQEAQAASIKKKFDRLSYQLRQELDESVIRVHFNGQSDEMLDFLEGLPTVDTLNKTFKQLGLPTPDATLMLEAMAQVQ